MIPFGQNWGQLKYIHLMETANIGIVSLIMGMLLLAPVFFVAWRLKIGIGRELAVSALRMVLQLGLVAIYLKYIFLLNKTWLNLLYVLLMALAASYSLLRSSSLKVNKIFIASMIAILIPLAVTILYFNIAILRLENLFNAMYLIPLVGLMLGNTLKSNIVTMKSFYNSVDSDEKQYHYRLAMGATKNEALLPYLRNSLKISLAPNLATMATVGIVSLPGMMTGQILGGSPPGLAVKYQVMVMVAIFFNSFFSNILQIYLTHRFSFNKFGILRKEVFKKKK